MTRISTKNARRIRRGVMAGQEAIRANRAGLPVYASFLDDELARRAWLHTIGRELVRLSRHAREALKTLKSLRGDS